MSVLHCPNASTVAEVRGALQRGDIFIHGFPHNGEASYFPDSSLFDAALALPQALAAEFNLTNPTTVSQRDVPGWTRATIPLLNSRGINAIAIGAGQPPGKPDTPPLFVWKDEASATDVVVTYESGYGAATTTASLLTFPPSWLTFAPSLRTTVPSWLVCSLLRQLQSGPACC
jgi:hypothetical protein